MPKTKPNYAFIDSQNLNLGVRSAGWQIDYRKLRLYLKNKYNVQKAYLFIGIIENNQRLYTALQSAGFILIFKPTVRYFENGKETVKGNVDAELVLHAAAVTFADYDKAIIISGDGDFACLHEFLEEKAKLLHIMTPNAKYSQLLKPFASRIIRVDTLKSKLSLNVSKHQKSQHRRSVETLGVSGNGDASSVAKKTAKVKNQPSSRRGKKVQ